MTFITIAAFIAALSGNFWLLARAAPSLARALGGPRPIAAAPRPAATVIRLADRRLPSGQHRPCHQRLAA